ncbi:hypothetical protein TEA_023128 [Camellia sinensis var. sinensis]|uniref:Uncharacterized protein n=1 Tax=Camellia sinensis var. sinensis TaxID=542762 RepID=A0A4S4EP96_CAMSN|nr:hypothetical protein TEA_023128 [Camellia sinensis var. sinensis]
METSKRRELVFRDFHYLLPILHPFGDGLCLYLLDMLCIEKGIRDNCFHEDTWEELDLDELSYEGKKLAVCSAATKSSVVCSALRTLLELSASKVLIASLQASLSAKRGEARLQHFMCAEAKRNGEAMEKRLKRALGDEA